MNEQEQIEKLKEEITKLKEEVVKLTDYLREEYKFSWYVRNTMMGIHGVDCKQSDDLKGVIMPDGKFIPYGEEYHKLYFLGKIRRP